MTDALRPAVAAIAFLTRVPFGRFVRVDARDVARGAWLFPAVGGIVGGASGLLADVTAAWLPALAAGGVAVGFGALVTGALHLDALADAADALGATSRERALEIMRDHAVGAYGAIALIVVCLLDAALLGSLAQTDDAALLGAAAGASGRAAMLPPARLLSYARAGEGGQGRILDGIGTRTVALGVVVAVLFALPVGEAGLWAIAAAALVALAIGLFAARTFGGVTGDVLGAIAKLAETTALAVGVAALS